MSHKRALTVPASVRRWIGERRGTAIIETAFILPLLLLLSIGAFDITRYVTRQQELQDAAAQVFNISMASNPSTVDGSPGVELSKLKQILMDTTGLPAYQVWVLEVTRCEGDTNVYAANFACPTGQEKSNMLWVFMIDQVEPVYAKISGLEPRIMVVSRWAQIG